MVLDGDAYNIKFITLTVEVKGGGSCAEDIKDRAVYFGLMRHLKLLNFRASVAVSQCQIEGKLQSFCSCEPMSN